MDLALKGKRALVTGNTTGIGVVLRASNCRALTATHRAKLRPFKRHAEERREHHVHPIEFA